MSAPTYFAVPDPADLTLMTCWRQSGAKLAAWPSRARYGPQLLRTDVPPDLRGQERQEWIWAWCREHLTPWHEQVRAPIVADPRECAARFAAFATRCAQCGRVLKDPASKTYGVGPECRDGWPAAVLAAFAEAVGRAHAAHLASEAA